MKIGDIVSRNKYGNDMLFKIKDIKGNIVILTGVNYRLLADCYIDDLIYSKCNNKLIYKKILLSDNYNYIPASILHIDSDQNYLDECMKYYHYQKIISHGYIFDEILYKDKIISLIKMHNPKIVVITGHDSYSHGIYKNSFYFIETVNEIRKYYPNIFIISGACQSDFYNLLKIGSNIASSPYKKNVHLLDPAIIASYVAYSDELKEIDLVGILKKTYSGLWGFGGYSSFGLMKKIFPRKDKK